MTLRFELLKLVHTHGLHPDDVIGRVKKYEAFIDEVPEVSTAEPPRKPGRPAGSTKKNGDQS